MRSLRLIARSVRHHWRAHLGLAAGTALAAAILSGALVVGDSARHTLHRFAVQRLGGAELAMTGGDRFLSTDLEAALPGRTQSPSAFVLALPGMAIAQHGGTGARVQVNRVQALGVDAAFWAMMGAGDMPLERREAAIDARLAERLGIKPGDALDLRVSVPGLLTRDAPLSTRDEESTQRARFTVKAIAADEEGGRFGLSPAQIPPYNVFVRRGDLEELAGREGRANLVLLGGPQHERTVRELEAAWQPEHAGLRIVTRAGVPQLETDRIFLDGAAAQRPLELPGAQGTLTYLVNSLRSAGGSTPYSFVTAGGPLTAGLGDSGIVINEWLASQLGVGEGGTVTIAYYAVLPSNAFEERTRDFTVQRVLPMEALAGERALVPEFPGLSDVESCADWKIGMPMDEALLEDEANEAYWKAHRTTPKALVTLAAGQAMWGNRFGALTAVRFPQDAREKDLRRDLALMLGPRDLGYEFRPVRDEAMQAVARATDLGGLFLGMSFFLLGSALLLAGLLYAFGVQQRAAELGTLSALGYTRRRIRTLLLLESLAVALPSALAGSLLGTAYAAALLIGLAGRWQDAAGRIPILFAAEPSSLAIAAAATVVCALAAAALALRRLLRHSTNALLHADFTQAFDARPRNAWGLALPAAATAGALAVAAWAIAAPPADPAGAFFGAGALALAGGLLAARHLLAPAARAPASLSIAGLARLNAARRRGRSLGLVASLAAGAFLVLAVSSMQTDLHAGAARREAGTGGFAVYAESTVPVLDPAELEAAVPGIEAFGLRLNDGDDASCLNLNHAIRPRVLGVDPQALEALGAFAPAGASPWPLLEADPGGGAVPALVGDSDTAMWTLKKKTGPAGDAIAYAGDDGRTVQLKLAGKLSMRLSVFQGSLLVSAADFTRLWPSREGFRSFLIDAPGQDAEAVARALEAAFDRAGMEATPAVTRLERFHAVESAYLGIFGVLGGIGLLLGAAATGVVVLRNLFERRREIALLRAVGYDARAVRRLLALEYGLLIALAAAIAAASSAIAMIPALTDAHGGAAPLARLGVLGAVAACAALCAAAALAAGLRRTEVSALRAE